MIRGKYSDTNFPSWREQRPPNDLSDFFLQLNTKWMPTVQAPEQDEPGERQRPSLLPTDDGAARAQDEQKKKSLCAFFDFHLISRLELHFFNGPISRNRCQTVDGSGCKVSETQVSRGHVVHFSFGTIIGTHSQTLWTGFEWLTASGSQLMSSSAAAQQLVWLVQSDFMDLERKKFCCFFFFF